LKSGEPSWPRREERRLASIVAMQGVLDMFDRIPAWRKDLTVSARDERLKVYHAALTDLADEDVLAAARLAVRSCKWFPVPAELLEFVRPKASLEAAAREEAAAAYQRVLDCNTYTPEAGACWSYRQIADEVGPEAAEAFIAAGGNQAFAWADVAGASIRHARFVAAYLEQVEARRAEQAALGAGASPKALTRGEARSALKLIESKAKGAA